MFGASYTLLNAISPYLYLTFFPYKNIINLRGYNLNKQHIFLLVR